MAPPPVPDDRNPDADGHDGSEITRYLHELREGTPGAMDKLVPLLYDDLRHLARQRLRGERDGHTLDTTALVHEAYMRLNGARRISAADRAEFFAAASNTMRRVLVDYARGRRRLKRGSGQTPVPLDDVEPFLSDRSVAETLALDAALAALEKRHPRAARVFEQRLFGGLSLDEIAVMHGTSTKTVQRDWEAARAWLRNEVGRASAM